MRMRTRKLVGTIALLALVIVYFLVVVEITARTLPNQPLLLQGLGYILGGILWVIPAGLLVRWMSRPDRSQAR